MLKPVRLYLRCVALLGAALLSTGCSRLFPGEGEIAIAMVSAVAQGGNSWAYSAAKDSVTYVQSGGVQPGVVLVKGKSTLEVLSIPNIVDQAISPSGQYIAVVTGGIKLPCRIFLYHLKTGENQPIAQCPSHWPDSVTWSSDEKLYFIRADGKDTVVSSYSPTQQHIVQLYRVTADSAVFLYDAKPLPLPALVAFITHKQGSNYQLTLLDQTGNTKVIYQSAHLFDYCFAPKQQIFYVTKRNDTKVQINLLSLKGKHQGYAQLPGVDAADGLFCQQQAVYLNAIIHKTRDSGPNIMKVTFDQLP